LQRRRRTIGARRKGPVRRGAIDPPKRRTNPLGAVAVPVPESAGFEALARLPPTTVFADLLGSTPPEALKLDRPDRSPHRVTSREAFLFSVILHMAITLALVIKPDLFQFSEEDSAAAAPDRTPTDRLVMLVEPTAPLPPMPPAPAPRMPAPPPTSNEMIIPKATEPAPPDEKPEIQDDLPFSKGNTDEFVADKESKKPGEPGEEAKANLPTPEEERRVADLLPDRFSFNQPLPRLRDIPPQVPEDPGKAGEDGPFENLRRFLLDKQFHNPEGGLVTGRNNTLYYNDKGANFVPWLRRMLHEVKKNWLAGMPFAAYYENGHVAVGVSVNRDGSLADLKLMVGSAVAGFDNAAVGALRASQLLPLPADYPDQRFDFILVFWYNEQPYDLFQ